MLGNLNYMADNGYKAYVISQPGEILQKEHLGKVQFIPLLIKHGNVSPLEVLKTIWTLYKIFKKERFDIIQYATSNAALYASIAGWMARVPLEFTVSGVFLIQISMGYIYGFTNLWRRLLASFLPACNQTAPLI